MNLETLLLIFLIKIKMCSHLATFISNGYKNKTQIIIDYNKTKCGVDKLDQELDQYRSYRATARWVLVLFYDLIGFVGVDSWVLYSLKYLDCKIVKQKNRRLPLYT